MFAFHLHCLDALLLYESAGPRSSARLIQKPEAPGPRFDTRFGHLSSFLLPLIQEGQFSVKGESICSCLGGLSLRRNSVVILIDRPDMTKVVYCGRKTSQQAL